MEPHSPHLGRPALPGLRGRLPRFMRPAAGPAASTTAAKPPGAAQPAPVAAAHARPAAANLLLLAGGVGGLAAVALLAAQPAWVVPAIALAVLVRYGIHQRRVARIVNGWRIGEEIAADDAVRAEDASMSLFVVVVTTTGALLWVWRAFAG